MAFVGGVGHRSVCEMEGGVTRNPRISDSFCSIRSNVSRRLLSGKCHGEPLLPTNLQCSVWVVANSVKPPKCTDRDAFWNCPHRGSPSSSTNNLCVNPPCLLPNSCTAQSSFSIRPVLPTDQKTSTSPRAKAPPTACLPARRHLRLSQSEDPRANAAQCAASMADRQRQTQRQ